MSALCHQGARVGRVQYRKAEGRALRYVIYERGADAREWFAEQEVCELRWYAFEPTEREKQFARNLLVQGRGSTDWSELLDLDASYRRPRFGGRAWRLSRKEPLPC